MELSAFAARLSTHQMAIRTLRQAWRVASKPGPIAPSNNYLRPRDGCSVSSQPGWPRTPRSPAISCPASGTAPGQSSSSAPGLPCRRTSGARSRRVSATSRSGEPTGSVRVASKRPRRAPVGVRSPATGVGGKTAPYVPPGAAVTPGSGRRGVHQEGPERPECRHDTDRPCRRLIRRAPARPRSWRPGSRGRCRPPGWLAPRART